MSRSSPMSSSQVEAALLSQRKECAKVSREVIQGGMIQSLPPLLPQRILLFGVGSSLHAARLTGFSLVRAMREKKDSHRFESLRSISIISCSSVNVGVDVIPRKDDWVLGFSHRGKTEATLRAMDHCLRAGAFVIQVMGRGGDTSFPSKMILKTSELEKCEPHTLGLTSALAGATSLFLGAPALDFWEENSRAPDLSLETAKEKAGLGPSILVGEWEGEWIAREGALKLMEMAQRKVMVYSSEEYFHGPQISLKNSGKKQRVWHVSLDGDLRAHEIQAKHRIKPHKSKPSKLPQVPQVKETHSPLVWSPLSWVPLLIELQWLSLAVAINRGKNPDGVNLPVG